MNRSEIIKSLFSDSYVEINKNHDEILDVIRKYKDKTKKKLPAIVNYDSHSDFYLNHSIRNINLANWVNYYFAEFNADEFFWIIPEYVIRNEKCLEEYFFRKENPVDRYIWVFPEKIKEMTKMEILYNKETMEFISTNKINHINSKCEKLKIEPIVKEKDYKKLNLYALPMKELGILKNKEVILSIDADAFCNTGYDTYMNIGNSWQEVEQLEKEFDIFLNALYINKIHPVCVSLTRSPVYFPKKYEKSLMGFFEEIKNAGIDTKTQ